MAHPSPDIEELLQERAAAVDAALAATLARGRGEPALARLSDAVRHAALGGGKRLRPFLVIEAARAAGPSGPSGMGRTGGTGGTGGTDPMPAAVAVEMIHAYSLVHDDLPAMDDADTRRGRPTVHVAFDEAIAVLAGDALLTDAFGVLADGYEGAMAARLVALLAAGAGSDGMVGGQMMDLYPGRLTEDEVVAIQARKTGALIEAAAVMGGVVGGAGEAQLGALRRYARALGLAFQVQDDVLDATSDAEALGKPAGRDQEAGKATFVGLLGLDGARARVRTLTKEAQDAIQALPSPRVLSALAGYLDARTS